MDFFVNTISKKPIFQTQEIDPSLKGVIGKLMNGFENERAKLKGRVIKSLKQQEETQLKRIARVKAQIFPAGLQEREISPIYFMNKFGMDIWDRCYEFQKNELDLKCITLYSCDRFYMPKSKTQKKLNLKELKFHQMYSMLGMS